MKVIVSLLVLLFFTTFLSAQLTLEVLRVPQKMQPASHESFVFKLNSTEDSLKLNVSVNLPSASWKVISSPQLPISLGQESSTLVVFVVEARTQVEPGMQPFIFQASSATDSTLSVSQEVNVEIPRITSVSAELVESPEKIQEGGVATFTYLLSNDGNAWDTVSLKSSRGSIEQGDTIVIAAGQKRAISVQATAPENMANTKAYDFYVDLELSIESADWDRRLMSSTKVLPKNKGEFDPYFRFPIQVGGSYVGARNSGEYEYAYQVVAQGAGAIDQEGKRNLKFFLRGPNQFQVTRLGNFDQYSLTYQQPNMTLLLGDHSFRVSRLLEFGRFSRGVGITRRWKDLDVQFVHHQPRFNQNINRITSLRTKYYLNDSWNFTLTGLSKGFRENPTASLIGLGSEFNAPNFRLEAEFAGSQQEESLGFGFTTDIRSKWNDLAVNLNVLYSDQNFQGFFTNSKIINSNISYRINRWNVSYNANINFSTPALDTFQVAAPFTSIQILNLSYRLSDYSFLLLSGVRRTGEDRFEPKRFDYVENNLRLRYRLRNQHIQWNSDFEIGQTDNLLAEAEFSTQTTLNAQTQVNGRVISWLQMGGLVQFLRTNRYDQSLTDFFLYGANLSAQLNRSLRASINYRNNFLLEQVNEDRSLLNASIEAKLGPHSFNGFFSYNIFRNTLDQRNYFFSLTYMYEIQMGISKRKDVAKLTGYIRARENQNVQGVGVILAGKTVFTDEDGFFEFRSLRPGDYQLVIDKGSMDIFDKPVDGFFQSITIGPGEEKEISISITTTGQINGKMEFDVKKRKRPSNIIIKLKGNNRDILTQVNQDGTFEARQLMPGEWSYEVMDTGWLDHFEITPSSGRFSIQPGEEKEVRLRVKEKEEKIRFKN